MRDARARRSRPRAARVTERGGIALLAGILAALLTGFLAAALPSPALAGDALRGMNATITWLRESADVAAAVDALEDGRYDAVLGHAEAGLRLELTRSDRLAALNALCVAHTARGTPRLGLPHCDQLVRQTWGDWRALNNRANALLAVGRLEAAIVDYERALDALGESRGPARVELHGRDGRHDGSDALRSNLELARERLAADVQIAQVPPPLP